MNLVLLLLIALAHASIYSKLSTLTRNPLTPNDYLYSTLGQFRLTLTPPTCQLQIESYGGSNYAVVAYYPRKALQPCANLTLYNNSLQSNNRDIILAITGNQAGARFDQVFVTIDEMAIIRISGVYFNQFQTAQNWISIFRSPQQYTYSISNLTVSIYNSLSFIQNTGNWGFSATQGELRIFRIDNVSKITRYNYTGFTLTAANLFDYNSNSIPFADFKALQYQPRCYSNNSSLAFQGPFTFAINRFWPELRLLDQSGYELLSIRYPSPHCVNTVGADYLDGSPHCLSWFCPPNTFQHQGTCLTLCPAPYFHVIGNSGINRCSLTCRPDHTKNTPDRICSCQLRSLFACPSNLKPTPFGCLCPTNTYFNSANQPAPTANSSVSSLCHIACGPYLYAHPDGLCLPCPKYCLQCNTTANSYSFLGCTICAQGYLLNDDAICTRDCTAFPGKMLQGGQCVNCPFELCRTCTPAKCLTCFLPYSLLNNTCLTNCPSGYKSQIRNDSSFACVPVPSCPAQFPATSEYNNQSACFCLAGKKAAYFKGCANGANDCALSQYFNGNTRECLNCPIGCLTCLLDSNNQLQCSSCRPEYSLFVTLAKNHYCERNSILSYCPTNYIRNSQVCTVNNFEATAAVLSNRNGCFKSVENCSVCLWGSNSTCSFCKNGYYLHQGLCLADCPNCTRPYKLQAVCLEQTIANCEEERTQSTFWLFDKNSNNQLADAYLYLTSVNFQLVDPLNDPLSSRALGSNQRKMVNIAYSQQTCLICTRGYGITPNGSCSPCDPPCLACTYLSHNATSCLLCDSFHALTLNNTCAKLNPVDTPCLLGQYRNESLICQPACRNYYRPSYSIPYSNHNYTLNCTLNCPDNHTVVASGTLLTCTDSLPNDNHYTITYFGSKYTLGNTPVYFFTSSLPLTYDSPSPYALPYTSSSRLLQTESQNSIQANVYAQPFGFLVVDNSHQYDKTPLLLQLQVADFYHLDGSTRQYSPNSIYGYSSTTSNAIDLIFNQTGSLYAYGRAYAVILLALTIVFLAHLLSYKTDNLFITFSMVYLTLPSLNLLPSASTLNCYSFLYGFSWNSYLQLFSNPRSLSASVDWFNNYLDRPHNNAHNILFLDNNLIRNCWSVFLFLIIVIALLSIIILIFKCYSNDQYAFLSKNQELSFIEKIKIRFHRAGYNKTDFDHSTPVALLLIFFIENSFLPLTYYSLINLFNPAWEMAPNNKLITFKIISALFLALIAIYSIIKYYINRIAGIYCFKRVLLGLWMGMISVLGGIDQNIILSVLLLVFTQLSFTALRFKYELIGTFKSKNNMLSREEEIKKRLKQKKRHKSTDKTFFPKEESNEEIAPEQDIPFENQGQNIETQKMRNIVIEEALIAILYVFLMLVNILKDTSILIIWLIINVFMVSHGLDFFEMVINFWHNNYNKTNTQNKHQFCKEIRNIWDFDPALKSLAETNDY